MAEVLTTEVRLRQGWVPSDDVKLLTVNSNIVKGSKIEIVSQMVGAFKTFYINNFGL